MKTVGFFILLLFCLDVAHSMARKKLLKCWTCENQPSNQHCKLNGKLETCDINRQSCQNEVRNIEGNKLLITKTCKQPWACHNNYIQNGNRGGVQLYEGQCYPSVADTVCHCCCNFRRCNYLSTFCLLKNGRGLIYLPNDPYTFVSIDSYFGGNLRMVSSPQMLQDAVPQGGIAGLFSKSVGSFGYNGDCRSDPPAPNNGFVYCTRSRRGRKSCTFVCESGFHMWGKPETACRTNKITGRSAYDRPTPQCRRINYCSLKPCGNGGTCIEDSKSLDGYLCICPAGYTGNQCMEETNECDPNPCFHGGTCVDGFLSFKCLCGDDARGTYCENVLKCPPHDMDEFEYGMITCDDGRNINSTCVFSCTRENFMISPPSANITTCDPDGLWSYQKKNPDTDQKIGLPCCTWKCPKFTPLDFVFVLDSSSSITQENWGIMEKFIVRLLQEFTVSQEFAHVAAFRYHDEVDNETQILLNDGHYGDNIHWELEKIPYSGKGTMTGAALNYALDVVLTEENGNRPNATDLIVVISDGAAQDDVFAPAKRLHATGALVYAIAVEIHPTQRRLAMTQMNAIAGSPHHLFVSDNFHTMARTIVDSLSSEVCYHACDDPDGGHDH